MKKFFLLMGAFCSIQLSFAQVSPLLKTNWAQDCGFNTLLPSNSDPSICNKDLIGCTGVQLAQIMKYWQYPSNGLGTINYTQNGAPNPTTLKFDTVTFKWDIIGDTLNQVGKSNYELQKLMLNSAYVTRSSFSPTQTPGIIYPPYFINNLGFSVTVKNVDISSSSNFDSLSLIIKKDLDNKWPVSLAITSQLDGAGHGVVIDGYKPTQPILFHINWGWGGKENGYYPLNKLATKQEGIFDPIYMVYHIKPKVPGMVETRNDTIYYPSFADGNIQVHHTYFSSDKNWQLTLNDSWLNLYQSNNSGSGNNTYDSTVVYPSPNNTPNTRIGSLTISNATSNKTIVIVQYGTVTTGIELYKLTTSKEMELSPNPARDILNVKSLVLPTSDRTLSIYNIHGDKLQTIPFTEMEASVNVKGLSPGIYFIQGQGIPQKFIIE